MVSIIQPYRVNLKAMKLSFVQLIKMSQFRPLSSNNERVINNFCKREFSGFCQKRTRNLSPSKREFPVTLIQLIDACLMIADNEKGCKELEEHADKQVCW